MSRIIEYFIRQAGVDYSLSDGTICYVVGDDGFGLAPVRRFASRGPQQHGDTDMGYLIDPRIFRLFVDIPGTSAADLDAKKSELYGILVPGNQPLTVKKSVNGTTRLIDAFVVGDIPMPTADLDGFTQRLAITFKANDPAFYDDVGYSLVFEYSGGTDTWEVPFAVPWTVGTTSGDSSKSLTYSGTIASYPQIQIVGPIANPVITQNTLGLKLDFTGLTLLGAEERNIDLRFGIKTVTDESGAKALNDLTKDSDLAEWRIEAHAEAPDGINSIGVSGTGVSDATKIYISGRNKYAGV
jgi:hypothetical protein